MRRLKGGALKPRAVAALVAFVGLGVALSLVFPRFQRAGQTSICQSNLKDIHNALSIYIRDYDEKTPPSARWNEVLRPYLYGFGATKNSDSQVNRLLDCPLENVGYALNRFYANGLSYTLAEPAATSVAVFDSTLQKPNASDFGASFPRVGVHTQGLKSKRGNNVLFVDGHVELVTRKPKFARFVARPQPLFFPKNSVKPRASAKPKR